MTKHMQINGFRAEVLSDEWVALLRNSEKLGVVPVVEARELPIKSNERKAIYQRAESEGFDIVVVERHIYATYGLRCTMKRRGGTLVRRIEARRNAAGVWYETKSSRSSFY